MNTKSFRLFGELPQLLFNIFILGSYEFQLKLNTSIFVKDFQLRFPTYFEFCCSLLRQFIPSCFHYVCLQDLTFTFGQLSFHLRWWSFISSVILDQSIIQQNKLKSKLNFKVSYLQLQTHQIYIYIVVKYTVVSDNLNKFQITNIHLCKNQIIEIHREQAYYFIQKILTFNTMQYLIRKTTLAIAIKQGIKQVGIQHQQQNIFKLFKESFTGKFENFKKQNNSTSSIKGQIFNNYEYPIGQDDRQQYYTGFAYEAKLTGYKITQNLHNGERKPLFLLQAYSRNEDPKKRATSKAGKKDKNFASLKKKVKKN